MHNISLSPNSFEELKTLIGNLKDYTSSYRTDLDSVRYELYRKTRLARIFIKSMKYHVSIAENNYHQTSNSFRYSRLLANLPNVIQTVVWFKDQETLNKNILIFEKQGIVLVNEVKKQSIKQIPHFHFFQNN